MCVDSKQLGCFFFFLVSVLSLGAQKPRCGVESAALYRHVYEYWMLHYLI